MGTPAPSSGAGTGLPAPLFAVPESFPPQARVFTSSEDVVWFQRLLWELGGPASTDPPHWC